MLIENLSYIRIGARDPQVWSRYGQDVLGLMLSSNAPQDGNVYLKMDDRPYRIAVVKSDTDRYLSAGWEVKSQENLEILLGRLKAAGVAVEAGSAAEAANRRAERLVKFRDPWGNSHELVVRCAYDLGRFISPVGVKGFVSGHMGLGHVVLPAPKLIEAHDFYHKVLGFDDTDYMHFKFSPDPNDPGMGMHFMHCNNPRHHSLGLFQGEHPSGLIHFMLEVVDMDEVGYGLDRALNANTHISASLGRHSNDRMFSFYMRTPGGFEVEYGCQGWQVDWKTFTPTTSEIPSFWGHKFSM